LHDGISNNYTGYNKILPHPHKIGLHSVLKTDLKNLLAITNEPI
jgi:hypothetical protein